MQPVSQKGSRHQDDRNLSQFRCLQRKAADIDPAPGTVYHGSDSQCRRQQNYGNAGNDHIKPRAHQPFIVHVKGREAEHQSADRRVSQIPDQEVVGISGHSLRPDEAGAEHIHAADDHQQDHQRNNGVFGIFP